SAPAKIWARLWVVNGASITCGEPMTLGNTALLQTAMLLMCGCARGQGNSNFEKQATALLLHRYETFVSARSKVLSQLHFFEEMQQEIGPKSLGLPFAYLMGGLKAVGPNTLVALEGASDTVLTGAKDYVGPEGLGMVSSRACYIAMLKA